MSEERNDLSRRRRRSAITEETPRTQEPDSRIPEETSQSQGPDSRVPAEARRMSAAPYGETGGTVRQRPGTRPATAVRRPVQETRQEPARPVPEGVQSRVRVGYAPGRMSESGNDPSPARGQVRVPEYPIYPEHMYQKQTPRPPRPQAAPQPRKEEKKRGRWGIHIPVIILILIGLFLAAVQVLPEDNSLRQRISGLTGKVTGQVSDASREGDPQTDPQETENPPQETAGIVPESVMPSADETEQGQTADPAGENPEGTTEKTQYTEGGIPAELAGAPEQDTEGSEDTEGGEPETTPAPTPTPEPTEEPTPTPEPTEEPTPTPEPTATPALTAEAAPGANPDLLATVTVYSGKKKVKDYNRAAKDMIHMPAGWNYTKVELGVLTFRGNAFRTNGAAGTVKSANELEWLWEQKTGSAKSSSNQTYSGTGWPGQPAIVQWSRQIRESANCNIYEAKKEKKRLKEVIIPGMDGVIRFLDLEDGTLTRNSIKLGASFRGTPSIHTGGFPYMSVGQYARKMKSKTYKIGLRQYNLYNQKELSLIDGLDTGMKRALNTTGSFETSALVDRTSDTVITAGTNGMLYLISLNSEFDWNVGVYTSKPSTIVMVSKTKAEKAAQTAVESSVAAYDKYVFYADMGGILRCVDTNTLTPVWAADTGDSVMAAVALDIRNEGSLDLYTANMLNNRKKGNAQIRRYDALSGKEIWCTEIGVQKDTKKKTDSGCKASPVIGENELEDMVYYTVTGLNDEGRALLNVAAETKAALVALDKDTGEIRWAYGLSDRSESSPIAVYDEAGNGRIIQCAWDGTIVMLDGRTGSLVSSMQVTGNIEASPAAYNDIMVIGTTGNGTETVYGIKIK